MKGGIVSINFSPVETVHGVSYTLLPENVPKFVKILEEHTQTDRS